MITDAPRPHGQQVSASPLGFAYTTEVGACARGELNSGDKAEW